MKTSQLYALQGIRVIMCYVCARACVYVCVWLFICPQAKASACQSEMYLSPLPFKTDFPLISTRPQRKSFIKLFGAEEKHEDENLSAHYYPARNEHDMNGVTHCTCNVLYLHKCEARKRLTASCLLNIYYVQNVYCFFCLIFFFSFFCIIIYRIIFALRLIENVERSYEPIPFW